MQSRASQVRIDNQAPSVRLTNDRLRKIIGNERLSFRWQRTCDQQTAQLLASTYLVQPRPQGTKLFRCVYAESRVVENVYIQVRMPVRMRATLAQIFISSQTCRLQRNRRGLLENVGKRISSLDWPGEGVHRGIGRWHIPFG